MAKKNVKGLNMEKVVEIRNEVEEVMETNTSVVISEMAEHVGASLEDIDALREMMVEETLIDMEIVKEMNEMKNKLDLGIRNAILAGKKETRTEKFVSGKRIKAILNNYKIVTGEEMSDVQINYIKTLNSTQIYNIELTIGALNRELRVEKFNQRMSQVMA